MKRMTVFIILTLAAALALLPACGGSASISYKDGTYTAVSSEDDEGAYAEVTIVVKDGSIVDCTFITLEKDGTVKAEDYGKINGEISNKDYYDKAQLAVRAMAHYAKELARVQSITEIDVVSGATISYDQFYEAVEDALSEAK